jgi:hypothetical protein
MCLRGFFFYETVENRLSICINFFNFLKNFFIQICQPILFIIDNFMEFGIHIHVVAWHDSQEVIPETHSLKIFSRFQNCPKSSIAAL